MYVESEIIERNNISFTDFSVDQEMAQLGFGIFTDQHGDPS